MASPFSVFRKNRTMMLVILTILSMFGFVFLPIFLQSMGSQTVSNPVVVKSKYGDLTRFDLHNLRTERNQVLAVLSEVLAPLAHGNPQAARQYLESEVFGPTTDEGLVDSWLLANYAHQKTGMVISDDIINGFLRQVTFNRVSPKEFQAAFQRTGVSERRFFAALREELLALQLKKSFGYSLEAATPAERWKYFTRVKEQARIEAVPVPVDRYVDRVADPSTATLKDFFEKHKNDDAKPDSPAPGFHVPKRIEMQYVKADYQRLLAGVSDSEVLARYRKDKALYDQMEQRRAQARLQEEGPAVSPKSATPPTKPATSAKSAKPRAENTPAAAPSPKEKKSAQPQPALKSMSNPPKAAPPGKSPIKTGEKKTDAKKADEQKKQPESTSSLDRPWASVRTVFAADKKPELGEAAKPAAGNAPKSTKTKATQAPAKPTKPIEAKPAKTPEKPAKIAPAKPARASEKPTGKAPGPAAAAKRPGAAKTEPSAHLKTFIRRQIVGARLQKAFQSLSEQIDRHRSAMSRYKDAKIKGISIAAPKKLDLAALARQAAETAGTPGALTAGATGWLSEVVAQRNPFCNSVVETGQPVWSFAFRSFSEYRPERSYDQSDNYYLFWKTGEEPARVPKFDDPGVAAEVLRAWKMIEARKPATDEAKHLADEGRKSKGSLKQTFVNRPDLPVVTPPPFSWLTFGQVPTGSSREVRMSRVPGVDLAGETFMETVFSLKPGQIGVAFNAPQTVAYVIRVTGIAPSPEALWTQFKVDDFSTYQPALAGAQRQIDAAWLKEIKASAGFKWTEAYKTAQQTSTGKSTPGSRHDEGDGDY